MERTHDLHELWGRLNNGTRETVEKEWKNRASEQRGMAWIMFGNVERMLENYGQKHAMAPRFLGEETRGTALPDVPGLLALAEILLVRLHNEGRGGRLDTVTDWPERPDEDGNIIRDNHNRLFKKQEKV